MELRSNHKLDLARDFILHTRANIFLTGKAGTGKTTLLRSVVSSLGRRAIIAAPTGVAALNAGGVTLHSLFQLPFGYYIPGERIVGRRISKSKIAIIRSLEMLIIDEVSMVRADMLDAIDHTLRIVRRSSLPFGGVQLLMIGDIQQLSPICRDDEWSILREHYLSPYFFDSKALRSSTYITIELDEIFRQSDTRFTDILNAIRDNCVTQRQLDELNRRYDPHFDASRSDDYITLTTHNHTANSINRGRLDSLSTPSYLYEATISGDFSESFYPNDLSLELKEGAQVLFIKNDISPDKRYYNGLIGRVVSLTSDSVTVKPNSGGDAIRVEAVLWENMEYDLNPDSGEMEQSIKGSFRQIPLRCAWAITIHKSQGLSFDHAIIDASGSFAHGQLYVALSRCRTLEGMLLRSPITLSAIIGEGAVDEYSRYVSSNQPTDTELEHYKRENLSTTLCEIFDYLPLYTLLQRVVMEMTGSLSKSYPKLTSSLIDLVATFDRSIVKIGVDFGRQLRGAVIDDPTLSDGGYLRGRLSSAAEYFQPRLEPLRPICKTLRSVETDSAETRRRIQEVTQQLESTLESHFVSLRLCSAGFSLVDYYRERSRLISLQSLADSPSRQRKRTEAKAAPASDDILRPDLYATLMSWRKELSREIGKPAYTILHNRTIVELQRECPTSYDALSAIHGMGRAKLSQYGDQLLEILRDYSTECDFV